MPDMPHDTAYIHHACEQSRHVTCPACGPLCRIASQIDTDNLTTWLAKTGDQTNQGLRASICQKTSEPVSLCTCKGLDSDNKAAHQAAHLCYSCLLLVTRNMPFEETLSSMQVDDTGDNSQGLS